jgi:hypothetical protein
MEKIKEELYGHSILNGKRWKHGKERRKEIFC